MSKSTPPKFKRKLLLEERINSGKKIEGLNGFVPVEVKCCSGNTKGYIPVKVVGIKLADCSFSIRVRAVTEEVIIHVREEGEDTFTTSPENFFQTSKEIAEWEEHLNKVRKFKDAMQPFESYGGTLTYMRRRMKVALEEAPPLLRAEIEEDCSDKDEGIKAMSKDWLKSSYEKLMLVKFFPEYVGNKEFDPTEDLEDEE